jgi:ATP-dependent RNA helicase DDX19/DBP5
MDEPVAPTLEKKETVEETKTPPSKPIPDAAKPTEDKPQDTNLIQNKYEVAVKLQDLQADPNSPLFSVKSFDELGLYLSNAGTPTDCRHPNLLKGIYAMKFQKPSKVQERALPLLLSVP